MVMFMVSVKVRGETMVRVKVMGMFKVKVKVRVKFIFMGKIKFIFMGKINDTIPIRYHMMLPPEIQVAWDAYLEGYADPEILAPLIIAVQAGSRPPQYIVEEKSSWSCSRSGAWSRAWSGSWSGGGSWLWSCVGTQSRSGVS